jgi:hypothetical protein
LGLVPGGGDVIGSSTWNVVSTVVVVWIIYGRKIAIDNRIEGTCHGTGKKNATTDKMRAIPASMCLGELNILRSFLLRAISPV